MNAMRIDSINSLQEINTALERMVELASTDYSAANEILKSHYFGEAKPRRATPWRNNAWEIETLLSGLQYMDVFTQRVNHLMAIHARISNDALPTDLRNPFYHLLAFHTLTITTDLIKSIASVRTALHELRDSEAVKLKWPREIFDNAIHAKCVLQRITSLFLASAGTSGKLSSPPLREDQILFLNSIYTTESERLVLKWFLQSMPGGTWHELMPWYINASDQTDNNTSIELF
jgi:hypothetical protein